MPTTKCPFCGNDTLEVKHGEYQACPSAELSGGTIVIGDATWQVCAVRRREILPYALNKASTSKQTKRQGLLTPEEVRQVRQRTGLSAVDMAYLLGVRREDVHAMGDGKVNPDPRETTP